MGCVTSKQAVTVTPAIDHSGGLQDNAGTGSGRSRVGSGGSGLGLEMDLKKVKKRGNESGVSGGSEVGESGRTSSNGERSESVSFRLGNLQKYVEGEQVAAGWPAWLTAVAREAIYGWVPLRAESFEKLEKIGQGTYSSVFRARDLETGKIVALKKVRFDNFEPESVRFMAREIMILRRLDHPNIIKLEGLITSRMSCSMYLVFEYMEHDIAGLLSSPDVKFSEAQVKCYMKQLLSGVEHCHSRGVMHRDIKGANLLVSDNGVLKVADFGLANYCNLGQKQPLTSRVVTLWYRPPELLLGSTDYGTSVDLWSVGCVFTELLIGKPVLQGRTEVEQLHKIFKLCGTPPDDYWKKSKLPHATLFKPQHPYESSLRETFKDLPRAAGNLVETLLSVEPYKRGTASAALESEYFKTKPYACDPSSLPKYSPTKEIDAKQHEDAMNVRKRPSGRPRGPDATRKLTRKQNGFSKPAPEEKLPKPPQAVRKNHRYSASKCKEDGVLGVEPTKPSNERKEEMSHMKNASQGDVPYSGPLQVSGSSGFAWARRRMDDISIRSRSRSSSRSLIFEPSGNLQLRGSLESRRDENGEAVKGARIYANGHNEHENHDLDKDWCQLDYQDSVDDEYHSQELSLALYHKEDLAARKFSLVYQDQGDKVEFSGPLLSQSHRIDELLAKHERQIRQAVRRSWFQKGNKKQGK